MAHCEKCSGQTKELFEIVENDKTLLVCSGCKPRTPQYNSKEIFNKNGSRYGGLNITL